MMNAMPLEGQQSSGVEGKECDVEERSKRKRSSPEEGKETKSEVIGYNYYTYVKTREQIEQLHTSDFCYRINPWLAKPPPSVLEKTLRNERMRQYAQLAFAHYQQQHQDVEFENVELHNHRCTSMQGSERIPAGKYYHIYFKAMPKHANAAKPKLFFTEIRDSGGDEIHVITCSLLEPSDPGIALGCMFCPVADEFPHPRDGHIAGHGPLQLPVTVDWARDIESGVVKSYREKPFARAKRREGLDVGQFRRTPTIFPVDKTRPENEKQQQWAELALAHYERQHGVEFERLKFIAHSSGKTAYTHLFFEAMPKNVNSTDVSLEFFFAEIFHMDHEMRITTCSILDPKDNGITLGCGICPTQPDFPHPCKGFRAGRLSFIPRIATYDFVKGSLI